MITDPILAENIRYNAATSSFEARVTVHGAGPARAYACIIEADLNMGLSDAEAALRAEALRRHVHRPGLYASAPTNEPVPMRTPANRPATRSWRERFDRLSGLRAA